MNQPYEIRSFSDDNTKVTVGVVGANVPFNDADIKISTTQETQTVSMRHITGCSADFIGGKKPSVFK